MNKEYREMTAEERLRVINAALNKNPLAELDTIINELKTKLAINESPALLQTTDKIDNSVHITDKKLEPIREIINKDGLAGIAKVPNSIPQSFAEEEYPPIVEEPKQGSIYSSEHRDLAMEENNIGLTGASSVEQPRTRILTPTNSAPNPWGDAEVVTPGQLKL